MVLAFKVMLLNGFYGRFNERRIEQINDLAHKTILLDRLHRAFLLLVSPALRDCCRCITSHIIEPDNQLHGPAKVFCQRLLQFILRWLDLQMAMSRRETKLDLPTFQPSHFTMLAEFARHPAQFKSRQDLVPIVAGRNSRLPRYHWNIGLRRWNDRDFSLQ